VTPFLAARIFHFRATRLGMSPSSSRVFSIFSCL
jgi:hypothetical protein